ncbi:efflux RND transporter permease subunit [Candidatus Nomurabacteria bacterium]|nr:efflux RND transporter permease subunit [Candidatus Nomurabacteria bacterium]MCB9803201.1 efflux RND transporter permease subunit [Candidatus Nomurabacteria bacterium]
MIEQKSLITRISEYFVTHYRIAVLIFILILSIGSYAYTTLLPREGFPSISFPIASVNIAYFVDDAEKFNDEILTPIEDRLEDLPYVDGFSSSTDGNIGNLFIRFEQDITSEDGADKLDAEILDLQLPSNAQAIVTPINVDSVDNVSDILIALTSDPNNEDELLSTAEMLKQTLIDEEQISGVTLYSNQVERTDPQTGTKFISKENFYSIGYPADDGIRTEQAVLLGIETVDLSTTETSELVTSVIDKLKDDGVLDGYNIVYSGDLAATVKDQISVLESNFLSGMVAVVVVLVLLVSLRASIVGLLFIPTVLTGTFVVMEFLGATLNVISLFALVLALGLFVDDAIVVIEAIDRNKKEGIKGIKSVTQAIEDIGIADVMGTLTTVLVFAPMLFISGVLGEFIIELPRTIIISLLLSLLFALTLTPLATYYLIPTRKKKEKKNIISKIESILSIPSDAMYRLGEKVGNLTKKTLDSKLLSIIVLVLTVGLLGIGMQYGQKLFSERFNPFPEVDDAEQLSFTILFPEGTTVDEAGTRYDNLIEELPEDVTAEIERIDLFSANNRGVSGNIELTPMRDREITAVELATKANEASEGRELLDVTFRVIGAGPPPSDYPFLMQVYAEDTETLQQITDDITILLGDLDIDGEKVTDVVVSGLERLRKQDGRRFAEIQAKLTDPENTTLILNLQEEVKNEFDKGKLDQYGLDEDALGFDLGQQSDNLESFQSLGLIGIIAIAAMYILLVARFDSFSQPFLIIAVAVILALPGVFIGLWTTGNYMSFLAAIGMIGLIGIVVNNTIMLVDFANRFIGEGHTPKEAMSESIKRRFRPLVTTTITTFAGLLPLALNDPFWEPISFTIIFGLLTSTLLVIFAFPLVFVANEWLRGRKKMLFYGLGLLVLLVIIFV